MELVVGRLERNGSEQFAGTGLGELRRGRLDDDVGGTGRRQRPTASTQAPCPQRRPSSRAPHQPVGGAPERLPRDAVQEEVGGEVDVEKVLEYLLNEDEQIVGHVGRVDGRLEENVHANGVTWNVEYQKYGRYQ